eukprot:TRINITY_DN4882_c0_g1_i1.p1 TRINITY_DN4882_c0_g1~~TRINITY_DN4882_c0_g1_i1.p1  ORF type:complete len:343 (+),score=112.70 TRINITY_DN4882_c0_g1_i1:66-1094(+)
MWDGCSDGTVCSAVSSTSSSEAPTPPPGCVVSRVRIGGSKVDLTLPSPPRRPEPEPAPPARPRRRPPPDADKQPAKRREEPAGGVCDDGIVAAQAECALLRGRVEMLRRQLGRQKKARAQDAARIRSLTVENVLAVDQIARLRLELLRQQRRPRRAEVRSSSAHERSRAANDAASAKRRSARAKTAEESLSALLGWTSRTRHVDTTAEHQAAAAALSGNVTARRALGPPPNPQRCAEAVDAAVDILSSKLRRMGVQLPLQRVGDCVYEHQRSGGRRCRRLHLVLTDAGRLLVRSGGGHRSLLQLLGLPAPDSPPVTPPRSPVSPPPPAEPSLGQPAHSFWVD